MIKYYHVLICILLISSCNSKNGSQEPTITIAAAANMQYAIEELVEKFEAETGIKCKTVISSSGKLTAQIVEGAPYNIFLSADSKYPNKLQSLGLHHSDSKTYALGKLIIWSMNPLQKKNEKISFESYQHVAIANPKTAPYGKASIQFLSNTKQYEGLKDKIVFGESIAQTNLFIVSEAAEVGFTALSVVKSPNLKEKGFWTLVDESQYEPIEQQIIVLNQDAISNTNAMKFYNFISSSAAQSILVQYGYGVE